MDITIRLIQPISSNLSSISLKVPTTSKISSLKLHLSSTLSLSPELLRILLLRDSTEILLSDNDTLASHRISKSSILLLDIISQAPSKEPEIPQEVKILPLPQRDWLGLLIEKAKSGSLTGILQILVEYEKENPGFADEEEDLLSASDKEGWSLMHYACFYGYSNIVQLLVARGANANKVNDEDQTPLMIACIKGHTECVRSLLKHNRIQVNKMTETENSALHKACKKGLAINVQLLIEHNASMILEDQNMMIPLQYASTQDVFDLIPRYMGEIEIQKVKGTYKPPEAQVLEGELYFTGSLVIHDKLIFASLDSRKGSFRCFEAENKEKTSIKPLICIQLKDISDIKYSVGLPFGSKHAECVSINTTDGNFKFYSYENKVVINWVEALQKGIEYCQVYKIGLRPSESVLMVKANTNEEPSLAAHLEENYVNFKSFTILEELGSGSFGKVYKVVKNDTKQVFALKQLNKDNLIIQNQLKYAIGECRVLEYLNHPFIIKLNYAFQTPKNLYMVLDYCPNGDLMDHIGERNRFPQHIARFYICEILLAIEYLHSLDIIYRDLKPENILMDRAGHIKLADFGLAKENVNPLNPAMSFCGSPAYLPPEVLLKIGCEKSADVYGIGAILYEMLTGLPPYYTDNIEELYKNIKKGMLEFPKFVKSEAQDVIRKMMKKEPNKRPRISQVKDHKFFKGVNWEEVEMRKIKPPSLGQKWLQTTEISEPVTKMNMKVNKSVNDKDYTFEDSLDKIANFNFSRSSASYIDL